MNAVTSQVIGLDPRAFATAFPFHLVIAADGNVIQSGSVLGRLIPELAECGPFGESFAVIRPAIEPEFGALVARCEALFMLRARAVPAMMLKGQMLLLDGEQAMAFLGSPWATDLVDLEGLDITLRDFALHDPIADYLFLLQTQNTALADARRLADELAQLNRELESRVQERTRDLAAAQTQLVEASRRAGMAEIASNVLHNIGNVLNSVNCSTGQLERHIRVSAAAEVARLAELFHQHQHDLTDFLSQGERPRQVAEFLCALADRLGRRERDMAGELAYLSRHIEHLKAIVAVQQSHARGAAVIEQVAVADVIETAFQFTRAGPDSEAIGVAIECQCTVVEPVSMDRHRVLQVLINLVKNAYQAVKFAPVPDKRITVRAFESDPGRLSISVADNGVGISAENVIRIFEHGFTTRPDGHGFGLHASANAAAEMGGRLHCRSDGVGRGAEFILDIPISRALQTAA
ncbi:MAG: ATP-binding protein [Proteobacteria bacterium]|nr:ATP-binding protein [Pseudomonadota bacterium]